MKDWYAEVAAQYGAQLVRDGKLIPGREAARLIGRSWTVTKEFLRWYRSGLQTPASVPVADRAEPVTDTPDVEADGKTWTDERSGTVFTDLGPDYGVMVLTRGEFRAIRRDYSKHYGGTSLSQSDLAIRYRFASAHAFDVFRRIHGLRQNSLPFTDDEIEDEGVDALVDKAIESKRQAFFLKLQDEERKADKQDAARWRALELNVRQVVSQMGAHPLETPPVLLEAPARRPYALVLGLTDTHVGKLCFDVFGQQNYNRKIAVERALKAVRSLLADAIQAHGTPSRIYLLAGSDNLHVDNLDLTTTRGTPQQGQSDGDFRSMISDYVALMRQIIQTCMAVAFTEIVEVEGNHDRASTTWIGYVLEEGLIGNPRATYTRQRGGLAFINWGMNSLIFLHGDSFKFEDAPRLALVAARERGLPLMPKVLVFSGDKHHEQVKDVGGVKVHGLPALCTPSEWSRLSKYIGSEEEMQAFVIRETGGKASVLYTDPQEICA